MKSRSWTRVRWRAAILAAVGFGALALGVAGAGAWSVDVTANPSLTRTWHWTIHKSVTPSDVTLAPNQSTQVGYSVSVSTTGYTDSDARLSGVATVNADPGVTLTGIDGLLFWDQFSNQAPFAFGACSSALPVALVAPVTCPYSLSVVDTSKASFVDAVAHGCENGDCSLQVIATSPTVDWSHATITPVDDCVSVSDSLVGSLGNVCAGQGTKVFTYNRTVGPYSTCGDYQVDNTASFVTDDTGSTGSSSATVRVHLPCQTGCTLTIGYWKTHAGFGPQADMVTPLLPIRLGTSGGAKSIQVATAAKAVQLLSFNGSDNVFNASNGINKLYAQLLGAKLSGAAGASLSAVASTIAAADAFLATHDSTSWSGLTSAQRAIVNGWASSLDDYNNGLLGPAHCTQ